MTGNFDGDSFDAVSFDVDVPAVLTRGGAGAMAFPASPNPRRPREEIEALLITNLI